MLHWRLHRNQDPCFKASLLRYAEKSYPQYQITVKLLGSFRLAAGRRHLHRPCIFTGQMLETVPKSLYHSCASELTRQGISLFVSLQRTISSSFDFAQDKSLTKLMARGVWPLIWAAIGLIYFLRNIKVAFYEWYILYSVLLNPIRVPVHLSSTLLLRTEP